LEGLLATVPHAFGQHESSREWCKHKEDPENYSHKDLPGGEDLKGDDLLAAIEDAMQPFLTEEAARKLAPGGSSLTEEEFNGYAEIINKSRLVGQDEDDPSELCVDDLECNCLFLMFAFETTGLHRHSDIIQIPCTSQDRSSKFSGYLLPTEDIADSATRVHGISVEFRNGQKVLVLVKVKN